MTTLGNQAHLLKYKLAAAACRRGGEPLRLAHTLRHLGDAHRHAQQGSLAERCYVEALSIYRSRADRRPLDMANALRSFAVLRDDAGAVEAARPLWQEAHELYASVNVPSGMAESATRLALAALRQGDMKQSREWLALATSAADAAGDPDTLHYVQEARARVGS